jgi:transcriptional regulator with XRE-family HTH domain
LIFAYNLLLLKRHPGVHPVHSLSVSLSESVLKAQLREYGEALRLQRTAAGLTQAQLAESMSQRGHPWHGSTVSKSESGDRDPSLLELYTLAGIFQTSVSSLVRAVASKAWLRRERELLIADLEEDIEQAKAEAADRERELNAITDRETEAIKQARERVAWMEEAIARHRSLIESENAVSETEMRFTKVTDAEDR